MVESFVLNFKVQAFWDKDAEVWVVTSDDVLGLATEACTIEALTQKLREMIPELILLNNNDCAMQIDPSCRAFKMVTHSPVPSK